MKGTIEDDRWVLNHVHERGTSGIASYRYLDLVGIVHRAVWKDSKWAACCGEKIVEKLQDGDAGAVTCVRCLGTGA